MVATVSASTPSRLSATFTLALSVFLAAAFGWMNHALFENRLWFSNIEQVEREISFRTEAGLYYSYYKQLTDPANGHGNRSILHAIIELTDDHRTEAPRSINVIQRFNVFQEIILAAAYRALQSLHSLIADSSTLSQLTKPYLAPQLQNPIFFYVYACFFFASLGAFAIFWLTCALSKPGEGGCSSRAYSEWPLGLLAVSWLFENLEDATRVNFTLNLREIFALPIFWLQNYFVIGTLQRNCCVYYGGQSCENSGKPSSNSALNRISIIISTFAFSALWQMNQFLLILQSAALFAVVILFSNSRNYDAISVERTVGNILCWQSFGFVLLIPLQGFQPMLLTSILVQLNAAILLSFFIFPVDKASDSRLKSASEGTAANSSSAVTKGKIAASKNDCVAPDKRTHNGAKTWRLMLCRLFAVALSICIFSLIRRAIFNIHTDDSHIWTFAVTKFRLLWNNPLFSAEIPVEELAFLPFETAIYVCHGAFAFIDVEFFERTSKSGLFPLYVGGILIAVFFSIRLIFSDNVQPKNGNDKCSDKSLKTAANGNSFSPTRPKSISPGSVDTGQTRSPLTDAKNNTVMTEEYTCKNVVSSALLYYAGQSALSGILACMMLRMKFFWLPQMIVLAACATRIILDKTVGKTIRNLVVIAVAGALFAKRYETFRAETANEQEFYDPDTVALMQWISSNAHHDAIFAGSMQLMAGVKCCTNRRIANHPHFEDKWLRNRTQTLYQIYARQTPTKVHEILTNEKVDYIIVEESICLLPPSGCTTTELIDFANYHIPPLSDKSKAQKVDIVKRLQTAGFKPTQISRFCTKVREFGKNSANLFKLVFQNPTFRIYEIIY